MGHYSKNLGPMADEVVTECEFITLDQKRRVKAVRTMWDTGSNATIGMDIIALGNFHLDLCQGEISFTFSLPNE
ncbi:MAG: hypothetical protein IJP74_07415 [Prevotella sp.]|nr:hypothetical protein [Prevotella sp.]